MTLDKQYTLQDAIDEALEKTNNGTTREVVRYLQLHHAAVLDENVLTIQSVGLGMLIRQFRKKPPNKDRLRESANLCFDFGLGPMDLDDEISVPIDPINLLNSECDWPRLEDATIDELDKHLLLRDAQQEAHAFRTQCLRTLRQAAARVVPGRTDIPLRDLRVIARKNK